MPNNTTKVSVSAISQSLNYDKFPAAKKLVDEARMQGNSRVEIPLEFWDRLTSAPIPIKGK